MFGSFKETLKGLKDEFFFNMKVVNNNFLHSFNSLFVDKEFFDDEFFDDLEEKLIELDILPNVAILITQQMENKIYNQRIDQQTFQDVFFEIINDIIQFKEESLVLSDDKLNILLVMGVNGVGKTTTISKLTNMYKDKYHVLLAAADTFRAGAIEQLARWANTLDVEIVKTHQGHAPSAVVYNAIDYVNQHQDVDLLICDTAGRLHNQTGLMEELKKIDQVIDKNINREYQKKNILVLDGTSGKNTLEQAFEFDKLTHLDGIIVTKIDTNFKVGLIINIAYELKIPIYFITSGENVEAIEEFNYHDYLTMLFKGDYNE